MTDTIDTLYSRDRLTWVRWLELGAVLTKCKIGDLTDDLCDSVGGCNILTIDMGDQAFIVLPCSSLLRRDATMTILVEQAQYNDEGEPFKIGWKVVTWGTIAVRDVRVAEDEPGVLIGALTDFMEMLEENADE